MMDQTDTDLSRRERAERTLEEFHGAPGQEVIATLAKASPDFARLLVDFAFGDVYSRPGLDRRSRQVATIAGLAAMGNAEPQLKWHIRGGLRIGLSREEIVEILIQMSVYGGFPAAVRALSAAKALFDEIDAEVTEADEAARQDDA